MTLAYTTRPLTDFTWLRPEDERVTSPFSSRWDDTLEQLRVELDHIGGRDVVLELDIAAHRIRRDGMPKADARVDSPAVVVSFDSAHGPMTYRADRYWGRWGRASSQAWQENVRAVVLTLERLRAVDRYGATRGEQYQGFKAIGGGSGTATAMGPATMTTDAAYDALSTILGLDLTRCDLEDVVLVRRARARTHPDRNGGDRTGWNAVEQAARALGVS